MRQRGRIDDPGDALAVFRMALEVLALCLVAIVAASLAVACRVACAVQQLDRIARVIDRATEVALAGAGKRPLLRRLLADCRIERIVDSARECIGTAGIIAAGVLACRWT